MPFGVVECCSVRVHHTCTAGSFATLGANAERLVGPPQRDCSSAVQRCIAPSLIAHG